MSIKNFFMMGLFVLITMSQTAQGAIYDNEIGDILADTYSATRMWVPDDLSTIRGVLVIGNPGDGDARNQVTYRKYQVFAEIHHFAVIGTGSLLYFTPEEYQAWESHLSTLADMSGHPELVNAPWAPIGFSNGGAKSYGLNTICPEKTIAFIANKGGYFNDPLPSEAALRTPGILIGGEFNYEQGNANIQAVFETNRARGALWSWTEEPGIGHDGVDDRLVLPLMDQAIRLRYPADQVPTATSGVTLLDVDETSGWLADQSTWTSQMTYIDSYDDYTGDPDTACWLLNEGMANLYRAFATYNKDVSLNLASSNPTARAPDCMSSRELPLEVDLRVDATAVPDWSKVELYDYDQVIAEVYAGDSPSDWVYLHGTLTTPGVHGLFALVTHADGITISTTDVIAYAVVPEPASLSLLALGSMMLIRGRRG